MAVAGPSGCGKSTLLNLLGLLEPLDAGEIWLDDVCVSRLSRRAQCGVRGRSIGYVFQSFLLIAGLTALENVLLAARYVGRAAALGAFGGADPDAAARGRPSRRPLPGAALGRRAAAGSVLPRGAQPPAARARRRAHRQPRRRTRRGDPRRAARARAGAAGPRLSWSHTGPTRPRARTAPCVCARAGSNRKEARGTHDEASHDPRHAGAVAGRRPSPPRRPRTGPPAPSTRRPTVSTR